MNDASKRMTDRGGTVGLSVASPADPVPAARRRQALRAVDELRRGSPIVLTGARDLLVLAAETACIDGIEEFALRSTAPDRPTLLLAPGRARALVDAVGPGPVALRLEPGLPDPDRLVRLADPVRGPDLRAGLSRAPVPAEAAAVLALLKQARLLPAALVTPSLAAPASEALVRLPAEAVVALAERGSAPLEIAASTAVPLEDAPDARLFAFRARGSGVEHVAIVIGDPAAHSAPLVRLHSECFTGDLLGSLRCDCGPQLRGAIRRMAEEGAGVLLYLGQEGRGIGLVNKLRAYALQDRGLDTLDANRALGFEPDERDFRAAAAMLAGLGIDRVRLLTNNPGKIQALRTAGVDVESRVAHLIAPNGVDDAYLATKRHRFGHLGG